MFVLIVGNGDMDVDKLDNITMFAPSETHASAYAGQLARKYPDIEIYKYKLIGKYKPTIEIKLMDLNEMKVNDKGEVYPK
jgi:hypothetical protein